MNRIDMLEPQRKRIKQDTCDLATAERLLSSYNACGLLLVDLLDYLHLNATGVRKILKKVRERGTLTDRHTLLYT